MKDLVTKLESTIGVVCFARLDVSKSHVGVWKEEDVDRELTLFMRRLLDRGYKIESITPKVSKAIKNAQ